MFVSRSASRILCLACSRLILSCVERWRSWRQSLCCSCGCWAHSSGGGGGGDDGGGEKGGSGGSGDADGGGLGGRPGGRGGSGSGGNFAGGAEGGGRGPRQRRVGGHHVERQQQRARRRPGGQRQVARREQLRRREVARRERGVREQHRLALVLAVPADEEAAAAEGGTWRLRRRGADAQAPSILRWVRYRRERGERSACGGLRATTSSGTPATCFLGSQVASPGVASVRYES